MIWRVAGDDEKAKQFAVSNIINALHILDTASKGSLDAAVETCCLVAGRQDGGYVYSGIHKARQHECFGPVEV